MSTARPDPTADRPADLVLTGGSIQTVDAARSWAQALAVRDGRIVAVGTDGDVRSLIGPSTRVVQLRGETVSPGFQDAHVHPVWGGLDLMRCDLAPLSTEPEYLARIAEYAAEHADEPWVLGGGWQEGTR